MRALQQLADTNGVNAADMYEAKESVEAIE
jgi:hypothetical protein